MSGFKDRVNLSQIINCHEAVRFAGVTDKSGRIVAGEYRRGTTPLLSKEEVVLAIIMSVIKMENSKTIQRKLGKIVCSLTLYEKLALATIPLGKNSYLLISFDKEADHESIISSKIWPLVQKAKSFSSRQP